MSTTDLAVFVAETPLADTHEHMKREAVHVNEPPDVLCTLFDHYVVADLRVAGADPAALTRLTDATDPDVVGRFLGVRAAWEATRHTGYGDAVRRTAQRVFDLDEIVPEALVAAQALAEARHRPGERLHLLRDVANLSHIQTDDFRWECEPDDSDPAFFLYDLSVANFVCGALRADALAQETGVVVRSPESLRDAIAALFARWGPTAIAVKTQHAYNRTLLWEERTDDAIRPILARALDGAVCDDAERVALGDWCLGRVAEEAARHGLPVKIHTGTYAGQGGMPIERIRAALLTNLLRRYPDTRFVLMHASYPYSDELLAIAKHFPNVWVDLCWAWSLNPRHTGDFVRNFIHSVPSSKLFAFGGDSFEPDVAVSYAFQAREWLTRTLQAEIVEGLLTEREAIRLAARWMGENQAACFDLEGTRAAIRAAQENA
jgi:predicted TIM-barrel fold metal-dependent hydrolase